MTLTTIKHGRTIEVLGRNSAVGLLIRLERRERAIARLANIRASKRAKLWQSFKLRLVRKTDVIACLLTFGIIVGYYAHLQAGI